MAPVANPTATKVWGSCREFSSSVIQTSRLRRRSFARTQHGMSLFLCTESTTSGVIHAATLCGDAVSNMRIAGSATWRARSCPPIVVLRHDCALRCDRC